MGCLHTSCHVPARACPSAAPRHRPGLPSASRPLAPGPDPDKTRCLKSRPHARRLRRRTLRLSRSKPRHVTHARTRSRGRTQAGCCSRTSKSTRLGLASDPAPQAPQAGPHMADEDFNCYRANPGPSWHPRTDTWGSSTSILPGPAWLHATAREL